MNPSTDCIEEDGTRGAGYRGKVTVTKSGLKCQRWDSKTPNLPKNNLYCSAKYHGYAESLSKFSIVYNLINSKPW